MFFIFFLLSCPLALAETTNSATVNNEQVESISKQEIDDQFEIVKKEIDLKDEVYKALIETKDEKITLLEGNLSSFISFSSLIAGLFAVVIAIFALFIGWINSKIDKKIEQVKELETTILNTKNSVDEIKANIEKQVVEVDKLYNKYKAFPDFEKMLKSNIDGSESIAEKDNVISTSDEEESTSVQTNIQRLVPHPLKLGDIYLAKMRSIVRPVLVMQNDVANKFSTTITVLPITSSINKAKLPTHVHVKLLGRDAVILTENVTTISKSTLQDYITTLDSNKIVEVRKALNIQLGSDEDIQYVP